MVNQHEMEHYVNVLIEEMTQKADTSAGETFRTVYLGGGTPSLLPTSQLQRILDELHARFSIYRNAEITIEANPEQLSPVYCRDLKTVGFNRLSIGIQSFHDDILRFLGRKHSAQEAFDAIHNAHNAGFGNLSIDLIYGVNERSNAMWEDELDTAFTLPIRHLSAYALTVEENSLLYRRIHQHKNVEPDEELASVQYKILCNKVATSAFEQYEISNFALKGWESKHNSAYWQRTPYVGLGPSAHSFDGQHRQWNAPTLASYFTQIADGKTYFERETLSETDRYNEYVLLRLRTHKGIDLEEMRQLFGSERTKALLRYFNAVVDDNHYVLTSERLHLTPQGLWFADGIAGDAFLTNE